MLNRLVGSVRRNHALEHATISILMGRLGADTRLIGRAAVDVVRAALGGGAGRARRAGRTAGSARGIILFHVPAHRTLRRDK